MQNAELRLENPSRWFGACAFVLLACVLHCSAAPSTRPAITPVEAESALADLKSDDWILRARGMAVLAKAHVPEAVAPIQAIYASATDPWTKGRALVALAELSGEAVLGEATNTAKSPAPVLRSSAIEALAVIGNRQSAPIVLAATNDRDARVVAQAIVSYAQLMGADAWELTNRATTQPAQARAAARALGSIPTDDARRRILAMLDSPDPAVRAEAAASIGAARYASGIRALVRHCVTDPSPEVQAQAAKAVRSFDSAALAAPLLQILKSDEVPLYDISLALLREGASPATCDEVAQIIGAPDKRYAKCIPGALDLLAASDADGYRERFEQYVGSADPATRAHAIAGLARCRQIDLFKALQPFLADDDPAVVTSAFAALSRQTRGAPPGGILAYLDAPLRSTTRPVNRAAIQLLDGRLTSAELPKALRTVERFLTGADDELRYSAAAALSAQSDEDAKTSIARMQGYLVDWHVGGPFPNNERNIGMATVYPPEQALDVEKSYSAADVSTTQPAAGASEFVATIKELKATWTAFRVNQTSGRFTLNEAPFPAGGKVLYFASSFHSPAEKAATLRLPMPANEAEAGKIAVWINGKQVPAPKVPAAAPAAKAKNAPAERPPEWIVPASLVKGGNHVLIKAAVESEDVWRWSCSARLVDADGKPVEALKFQPVD